MALRRRKMVGAGVSRLRTVPLPVGAFGVPPVSGYLAWFDAMDASSLTVSDGHVSQWSDKSGNGNHLVQATAANQPNYGLSFLNGAPCVGFDGANDTLGCTALSGSDRTFSWFAAMAVHGLADTSSLIGSGGGTGGLEFRITSTAGDGHLVLIKSGTANLFDSSVLISGASRAQVMACCLSDTDITLYLNRTSDTGSNSTTFTAARTVLVGVNRGGGTSFARIHVGELIAYGTTVGSTDALKTIDYLMSKWGIT